MPIDAATGWVEPDIVINERALSVAECITLRVAVAHFILWIDDPETRVGLGESLARNYEYHAASIEATMLRRG